MTDPNDIALKRKAFFDQKRAELQRQATGQQQEADDVITRRMAAIGQANSGAAINQQLKAREAIQAQAQAAQNDLAGNELQAQIQDDQFSKEFGFKKESFDKSFGLDEKVKMRSLDLEKQRIDDERFTNMFNAAMASLQSPFSGSRVNEEINSYVRAMDQMRTGQRIGPAPLTQAQVQEQLEKERRARLGLASDAVSRQAKRRF